MSQSQSPAVVHLVDVAPRPKWLQKWEILRHTKYHWLMEGLAEFMGVYFYTYAGVGATATFNVGNIASLPGVGSLFTVGMAYALGIVLAVGICSPVGGGHFNPCVTIASAVWKGFPWRKVPMYIFFQILGGYFACLLVYGQFRDTILALEKELIVAGKYEAINFTPNGLAGIFGLYAPPGVRLRTVFMNEFFVDFFLALVIWAIHDPTNFFIPPAAALWVVGFAYGIAIWGFAANGLAANSARDVGGRLAALTFWGLPAGGGAYAAIAALTNIPATLFATFIYELFLTDSFRTVTPPHLAFDAGHRAHLSRKQYQQAISKGLPTNNTHEASSDTDKRAVAEVEDTRR